MNYALLRRIARNRARSLRWRDSEIEDDLFQEAALALLRWGRGELSGNYTWARANGAITDYVRTLGGRPSRGLLGQPLPTDVEIDAPMDDFAAQVDTEVAFAAFLLRLSERDRSLLEKGRGLNHVEAGKVAPRLRGAGPLTGEAVLKIRKRLCEEFKTFVA